MRVVERGNKKNCTAVTDLSRILFFFSLVIATSKKIVLSPEGVIVRVDLRWIIIGGNGKQN